MTEPIISNLLHHSLSGLHLFDTKKSLLTQNKDMKYLMSVKRNGFTYFVFVY